MKIYLVGGAVRDRLMGRAVTDRDWVVVGGTPEAMQAQGFQAVGGGFPVFLHPVTREEYALARTERRTGPGHRGFETWFAPDVTLEEDLRRRDLTINAMAMTPAGETIDPFGGQADLASGWLRAVSPAFAEDPLRILRVARFAAQFPGFRVHPETLAMMREMMRQDLLAQLPAERVWRELDKATHADGPDRFLDVLGEIPAFLPWFREWQDLPLPVPMAGLRGAERLLLWCEALSPEAARALCTRVRVPNAVRDLILHALLAAPRLRDWHATDAGELVAVLERMHAFHPDSDAERILRFLEQRYGLDLGMFRVAMAAAGAVSAAQFPGISGRELGAAIRARRVEVLDDYRRRR